MIMAPLLLSKNIRKKPPLLKHSSMNLELWSNFNMKIWLNCWVLGKTPLIKTKMKQLIVVLPSFFSLLEEGNSLTLLPKLENSQKRCLGPISTRWWMDYITCIKKVTLIETSSHRTYSSPTSLSWKLQTLDFQPSWKEKMELEY